MKMSTFFFPLVTTAFPAVFIALLSLSSQSNPLIFGGTEKDTGLRFVAAS